MKKTTTIIIVAGLLVAGSVVGYSTWTGETSDRSYRCIAVERGDLESVVSCSGNLEPTKTVQVGTQVSGIVTSIFVDFNDRVWRGQTIALIDTTLLVNAVREAEATLERSHAQVGYAEREFARIDPLRTRGMVTEAAHSKALLDVQTARAAIKSARLSVDRARRNLNYATIVAPISGTVVERNVDVGQTVAASLSAPQLFLIANNLSNLQIRASVDESDIGQIHEEQIARFRVQAYPEEAFTGIVRQVRLQSSTSESVVNYTVVIDVMNADGRLLPGMTATVDFIVKSAKDVLKVANAALRFRPTMDMMTAMRESMRARRSARPDSAMRARRRPRGDRTTGMSSRSSRSDVSRLWYLGSNGEVGVARVRTGITDGKSTEIIGRNIVEGMQIIAGVTTGSSSTSSTIKNPFQSQQTTRRRGRRGGF